jgi:protein-S-isoprenylcysteine O-methyltransferase Ste14
VETLVKVHLVVFGLLYVGVVYVWRIVTVWRTTGIWPVTYGKKMSAHDLVGKLFAALVLLSIASIVIYVGSSEIYRRLIPLSPLESLGIQIAGILISWLSMVWTILAQRQMGAAWRIGIDTDHPTELIEHGLFSRCRHPIYLGVMATSLGLFLVMPTLLMAGVLVATGISLSIQARLEERHLAHCHGDSFIDFSRRTRHWM